MVNNKPLILGLSFLYHDSAAVLLRGEEIIAAVQEERFTRKKFHSGIPENAIRYCFQVAGCDEKDLDIIAFYEDPHIKYERLYEAQLQYAKGNPLNIVKRISNWVNGKYNIEEIIAGSLPRFSEKICFFPHHHSHAASAFMPSPFESSSILTVDGIGEWSSTSIGRGSKNEINIIAEQRFPHSLGLCYSAFTQFAGFKVDSGEYKLMGLAPYGEPKFVDVIRDNIIDVNDEGEIVICTDYFDYMAGHRMINERFEELFGFQSREPDSKLTQEYMDVACSIQKVTEDIMLKMVKHVVHLTGERNLCMAGGVALNCVANGKILRSGLVDKLWVQPAAGDAGGALGAAYLAAYGICDIPRTTNGEDKQKGSLLGPKYSSNDIRQVLNMYGFVYEEPTKDRIFQQISEYLANGKICALFQGRMEFGPRALGNRSIIGDPRNPIMQSSMNLKIKFRESFRPFAPVVLAEKADEWFDLHGQESPYMLITTSVAKNKQRNSNVNLKYSKGLDKIKQERSDIAAVTHVDNSARVQTVTKDSNNFLYGVLKAFDERTGCPVLINTSFNVRGEPIVCSPVDALRCFMNTDIDVLIMEGFIVRKENQGDTFKEPEFATSFERD